MNAMFRTTRYEDYVIRLIARRYVKEVLPIVRTEPINAEDWRFLLMDLQAVHTSNPLNLHMMLIGRLEDLAHDVGGIQRWMNRASGKLVGTWTPRYTLAVPTSDEGLDRHVQMAKEGAVRDTMDTVTLRVSKELAERLEGRSDEDIAAALSNGLDTLTPLSFESHFVGQFMQPVIEETDYYEIETDNGTEYLPVDVAPMPDFPVGVRLTEDEEVKVCPTDPDLESVTPRWGDAKRALRDCVTGEIRSIEQKHGFLARMSAAGYLDCTEWAAFATEQEARDYLIEQYGNEPD